MPDMKPVLSVRSLSTVLPSSISVVDNVSLEIVAGETFALLGESGCGKSMTALSLMRLLPDGMRISAGSVFLSGVELSALPEREMRAQRGNKLAMIFQEPGLSLNPVMTVGEQIAEVLKLHGVVQAHHGNEKNAERSIAQRCIELLQQVGIPDAPRRIDEYPFQLSGGMKQRVMIAMALAGQPKVLIADEPTTALDVTIQAQVLQLLRETQRQNGMAMLLITHDLGVVAENAHRVAVMYAGQIVEQASREQLFAKPAHPYTQKLFAALPEASHNSQPLLAIPGGVPPLNNLPSGCRFAPRCDQAWARCHEMLPVWTALDDGRGVRCHLYEEEGSEKGGRENRGSGEAKPSSGANASRFPLLPSLLQVENLQVHFPIRKGLLQRTSGYVKAVDGVSLTVAQGRTVALVGESGCGKTTVGKALLQLIQPTAGSVHFAGQELVGLSTAQLRQYRSGMQMVFQDPFASLNPKMRVAEILREGMEALNFSSHQQDIDQLLEQVGLPQASKWRYPHEFSGGQRQRIAIARALAVNPSLLICDEPTSALDVSVQAQILNLMKSLQQKLQLSYLFITHNLAVVEYLAHDVCVMYLGRIVERGTVAEVMRQPRHPYTLALLSAVPRIDSTGKMLLPLAGEMPSPANPPSGCYFHPRCPKASDVCRVSYPVSSSVSATHKVHCHFY